MPIRHALSLTVLMLGGCVQARLAYVPESGSAPMGYADLALAPARFRVSYSAPKGTPIAQVDRLAMRRAAELSLIKGYAFFVPRDRVVTRGIYVLPTSEGSRVTYRGGYGEWRRFWRFYCVGQGLKGCDGDPLWPSRARLVERVEVSYIVDLLSVAGPESPAVDASRLLALQRREDARPATRP